MCDLDPVAGMQPLGHDRAVAGVRISLHAEQARVALSGQLLHEPLEISTIKDLARVARPVGGGQLDPGPFAHALASVLRVLQLPKLRGWCQLEMMAVADLGSRQCPLET